MPANVLIPEISSRWQEFAVPFVLEQDLATSSGFVATSVQSNSISYQLGCTQVLRTTVQAWSGRLSVEAVMTNVATQRNTRVWSLEGSDLISELNGLAKQIDPRATQFSTKDEHALQVFIEGVSSADAQVKAHQFREAIAADTSFGLAYIALAETLASSSNPELRAVLESGESHGASFTLLDRARFELVRSKLLQAPLSEQIRAESAVVKISPNNSEALAELASNLFLAGNGVEGEQYMERALAINPGNAQLREQLAIGLVETKQFAKAERILQTMEGNPAILPQLAFCILLEGDVKRASSVYQKFVSSIPSPDIKTLLQASWQAWTGHVDEAIQQLGNTKFSDTRLLVAAKSQLVLWQLMEKQNAAARQTATEGNAAAELLANGAPSAEAWRAKVETLPESSSRELLLAYGYFLHGFYQEAADAWQKIEERSGGASLQARVMLAASLKLVGKIKEANKISVQPFIPDLNDYYGAVSFNQLRMLLG